MNPTLRIKQIKAGSLKRLLGGHELFTQQPESTFQTAQNFAQEVVCAEPAVILERGDVSAYAWFLVEGEVSLEAPGTPARVITAADPDAGYPIANLRPCRYTVRASLNSKLVRLEQSYLKSLPTVQSPARFVASTPTGGGTWQSHPFALEVVRMQQAGEFTIPAMPSISTRISDAMSDPDFAVADMDKLIGADPAIAGRLMSIANSALFKRHEACQSLHAAIVRLGLQQTRTLVLTLATKSLFASQRSWIRKPLLDTWRHAVDIAAYAAVLTNMCTHLDRAQLLLLGLLHELGAVPILNLADRFPSLKDTPGVIETVLANLAPTLTATSLRSWGLTDFAMVVEHQENWAYRSTGEINLTDVLITAHLHARIKAKRFEDLPRMDEIPAFQKFSGLGLDAKAGVVILEEAQQEVQELRSLLS